MKQHCCLPLVCVCHDRVTVILEVRQVLSETETKVTLQCHTESDSMVNPMTISGFPLVEFCCHEKVVGLPTAPECWSVMKKGNLIVIVACAWYHQGFLLATRTGLWGYPVDAKPSYRYRPVAVESHGLQHEF